MNAINAYRRTAVITADPMEILIALYDGFIRHAEAARMAYEGGDRATAGERTSKAMAIVSELRLSIDHSQDETFTERLSAIYGFVNQQLMRASLKGSGEGLPEVIGLMKELREAWAEASTTLRAQRASQMVR